MATRKAKKQAEFLQTKAKEALSFSRELIAMGQQETDDRMKLELALKATAEAEKARTFSTAARNLVKGI